MPGPPDDPGTVRALLFGGPHDPSSGGGPPVTIPALEDGSPPPSIGVPSADGLCTVIAWQGGPPRIAVLTSIYQLAPHQHQSTQGRAPYRYLWTGTSPVPGIIT